MRPDREATCDWNCTRPFPHDGPCCERWDDQCYCEPTGKRIALRLASAEAKCTDEEWRIVQAGQVAPLKGGHGTWVETDHPAVIACMGSEPPCITGGCQLASAEALIAEIGAMPCEWEYRDQICRGDRPCGPCRARRWREEHGR